MSKTNKDSYVNWRKEEKRYMDHPELNTSRDEYIKHKQEKRMNNALRSNNLDELMSFDDLDFEY